MRTGFAILALAILLGLAGLSGCERGNGAGRDLSSEARSLVASNNTFAFELYGRLKGTNQNLFFSPYSISECLALSYAGARGNTEKQMGQALHFGTNNVHSAFGELRRYLNQASGRKGLELSVANGVWAKKGQPLLVAFTNVLWQDYDAPAWQVDFATEAKRITKQINEWVGGKTSGRIRDVFPAGLLDDNSRLVLVNAVYFKGTWKTKFKPELTRESDFYVGPDRRVKCPMMFGHGKFRYYRHSGPPFSFEIIELPYAGEQFSLVALLALGYDGLGEIEGELNDPNLRGWLSSMQETELLVVFPKFKLRTNAGLEKTLAAMGMPDAFDDAANFSGVDGTTLGYISFLRHEAIVEVDEAGTRAAAATASHHGTKSATPCFRADHPFLFLIRDNLSGSILFLGRLNDPTAG
jgi:serpin B